MGPIYPASMGFPCRAHVSPIWGPYNFNWFMHMLLKPLTSTVFYLPNFNFLTDFIFLNNSIRQPFLYFVHLIFCHCFSLIDILYVSMPCSSFLKLSQVTILFPIVKICSLSFEDKKLVQKPQEWKSQYLDKANRQPFMEPQQDKATNTGTATEKFPNSLSAKV